MTRKLLVDYKPIKFTLDEDSSSGKVRVRGEFAKCDIPTANKRLYGKQLWEREIGRLNKSMMNRSVMGEMDHPADGKTSLNRVSHIVTNLSINEDGILVGEAEILPTERGNNLMALLKSGVQVGISSRGFGSLKTDKSGNDVVQEDYKLNTFDFVADPADQDAYPSIIESVQEVLEAEAVFSGAEIAVEDKPVEVAEEVFNAGLGKQLSAYLHNVKNDIIEEIVSKTVVNTKEISENASVDINKQLAEELQTAQERISLLESVNEDLQKELHSIKLAQVWSVVAEAKRPLVTTLVGDLNDVAIEVAQARVTAVMEHINNLEAKFETKVVEQKTVVESSLKTQISEKNQQIDELTEDLNKLKDVVGDMAEALQKLAIENHTAAKMLTTPNSTRVREVVENLEPASAQEVDAIIEATTSFRVPKDSEDLQATRARVRQAMKGGYERKNISEGMEKPNAPRDIDYNGTGVDADFILRYS